MAFSVAYVAGRYTPPCLFCFSQLHPIATNLNVCRLQPWFTIPYAVCFGAAFYGSLQVNIRARAINALFCSFLPFIDDVEIDYYKYTLTIL